MRKWSKGFTDFINNTHIEVLYNIDKYTNKEDCYFTGTITEYLEAFEYDKMDVNLFYQMYKHGMHSIELYEGMTGNISRISRVQKDD